MSAAPTELLSLEQIRAQFPALRRQAAGRPVAYFDGPGGTQIPERVADRVVEYLLEHNANTHWAFASSAETDAMLDRTRGALADFLGARPSEVAFGANMTTLTFHLARALGRSFERGDEIVVTELDHQANVAPWRALEVERGVRVRSVPMDPESGTLDEEAFAAALTSRTRVVALGAASNALGTIPPVRRLAEQARAAGALVFIDAVHYAAHELVDVGALGGDFLACSPYKFYGPHLGVLWGREELIDALDVPRLPPAPNTAPERLETGTLCHEAIAGAAEAVEFLASLAPGGSRRERLRGAFAGLHERARALLERLWEGLSAIAGVHLYGPPPDAPRTPTLAFTVAGRVAAEVAGRLAREHGLFLSHGDFYATTVAARLGLASAGLVRAGCACYTSVEEVERLVAGVRALSESGAGETSR